MRSAMSSDVLLGIVGRILSPLDLRLMALDLAGQCARDRVVLSVLTRARVAVLADFHWQQLLVSDLDAMEQTTAVLSARAAVHVVNSAPGGRRSRACDETPCVDAFMYAVRGGCDPAGLLRVARSWELDPVGRFERLCRGRVTLDDVTHYGVGTHGDVMPFVGRAMAVAGGDYRPQGRGDVAYVDRVVLGALGQAFDGSPSERSKFMRPLMSRASGTRGRSRHAWYVDLVARLCWGPAVDLACGGDLRLARALRNQPPLAAARAASTIALRRGVEGAHMPRLLARVGDDEQHLVSFIRQVGRLDRDALRSVRWCVIRAYSRDLNSWLQGG